MREDGQKTDTHTKKNLYHTSDSSNEGFLEKIKVAWALFSENPERRLRIC